MAVVLYRVFREGVVFAAEVKQDAVRVAGEGVLPDYVVAAVGEIDAVRSVVHKGVF